MADTTKKKKIMRCPSDKMLEKIIAILVKTHDLYGSDIPSADRIRYHWEDKDLKFQGKEIKY